MESNSKQILGQCGMNQTYTRKMSKPPEKPGTTTPSYLVKPGPKNASSGEAPFFSIAGDPVSENRIIPQKDFHLMTGD
jgi:hypothetical protein